MDINSTTLTQKDVARITGRSLRTVQRWMRSGRLPFSRDPLTGRVTFTESDVRAAVAPLPESTG